jgi:hypothetical protein
MATAKHTTLSGEQLAALPIILKKPESDREEAYMREICEFEFYNLEEPGVMHSFPYGNTRNKTTFRFFHGGRYKLPRFIANWVESRSTPIWDWRPNGSGQMSKSRVGDKPRFQMRHVFS